jgi:hypothetical protein
LRGEKMANTLAHVDVTEYVMWKCNNLKVPGRGDKQLEEHLDFSDKQNAQMLWGPDNVADLGLPPDGMLLVQVPGTANDRVASVTHFYLGCILGRRR